ncbi:TPA: helix-turn-helix domain-containing protein [Vibrio diabolicus]
MRVRKRRRTDDQKLEVIRDYNNGMLLKDIEMKYKMSRATVYKYISELESKLLSFDEFLEKKNEVEAGNTSAL